MPSISTGYIVTFFLLLLANRPLARWVDQNQTAIPWLGWLYGTIFFGFLAANLLFVLWAVLRSLRSR